MTQRIFLSEVASTRSGDKGNHANLGVVACSEQAFCFLQRMLTPDRVHDFYRAWGVTRVERFELPKVWALNFMLYNALAGGASQSLRLDTQGKLIGAAASGMELPMEPADQSLLEAGGWTPAMRRANGERTGKGGE